VNCEEFSDLLGAYIDNELDARSSAALEICPACRQKLAAEQALHQALADAAPELRYRPNLAAKARLRAALQPEGGTPARRADPAIWSRGGLQIAALLAMALVGFGLGRLWPASEGRAALREELVASHVRARLSGHPADVPSSDGHTVKPWFNGKVDYAPVVIDLAASGFPLLGGRLDYIDGRPTAVLLYGAGRHTIDVFTWPATRDTTPPVPGTATAARGFHLVGWSQGGMVFWAVSDAVPDRLQQFAQLLARASPR
jgi:anti-sigma factor RsiW